MFLSSLNPHGFRMSNLFLLLKWTVAVVPSQLYLRSCRGRASLTSSF